MYKYLNIFIITRWLVFRKLTTRVGFPKTRAVYIYWFLDAENMAKESNPIRVVRVERHRLYAREIVQIAKFTIRTRAKFTIFAIWADSKLLLCRDDISRTQITNSIWKTKQPVIKSAIVDFRGFSDTSDDK